MSRMGPLARVGALADRQVEKSSRSNLHMRLLLRVLATGAALALFGCVQLPKAESSTPGTSKVVPSQPALPGAGLSSLEQPLKGKVDQLTLELLGENPFEYPGTELRVRKELDANPPVKYPQVTGGCGNMPVLVLDVGDARETTRRVFRQWGIELESDVVIKAPGYDFVADGYSRDHKIGFKLLRVNVAQEGVPGGGRLISVGDLDESELLALDKDVEAGKLRMFVADQGRYEAWGKQHEAYYLASVLDYLNWVHGHPEIDLETVLGYRVPTEEGSE